MLLHEVCTRCTKKTSLSAMKRTVEDKTQPHDGETDSKKAKHVYPLDQNRKFLGSYEDKDGYTHKVWIWTLYLSIIDRLKSFVDDYWETIWVNSLKTLNLSPFVFFLAQPRFAFTYLLVSTPITFSLDSWLTYCSNMSWLLLVMRLIRSKLNWYAFISFFLDFLSSFRW